MTTKDGEPRDWAGMTKAERERNELLHKLFTEAQRTHAEHVRRLDEPRHGRRRS